MTAPTPFLLQAGGRSVFALHHAPVGAARGAIVYAPPFAEEMNKSRRMAALQARALAAAGWHVLQFDYSGTGDSEGDFADARWAAWLDEAEAARAWLQAASGHEPWLWGLRLGALVMVESARRRAAPGLLLWQPLASGKQGLQQFLRLKAGAEWLAGERERSAQIQPMDQLKAGETVEVAGYRLHPDLALPMAQAELVLPIGGTPVRWLEVSPRAEASVSPVAQRLLAPLGEHARAIVVQGSSFWQALEIETAPALIDATLAVLDA